MNVADLASGQTVGKYRIVRRLGQGGMSNVYLADEQGHDRQVVLKFPHEELLGDISSSERFSREVKIGQLLQHPNIQALYELSHEGSATYLALEYVPGESLRRVMRDRKHPAPDDFERAVSIGAQVGRALSYAHGKGITHRDLKPENVIVTPDGVAKVMDFGIALLRSARRITWGPLSSQVGTPDYMAPERIQGSRGDERTDVYALGMMLYEYIAGRLPYEGDEPLAMMNQHVNVKAPPIRGVRKDVPPALDEIIGKAIRRKAEARWPTMEAFVEALENPDSVDVDALAAEREAEPDGSAALARVGSRAGVPVAPVTLVIAGVLIGILVVMAVVASLPHHH
jgi:serine/threonine-protein kinase